MINTYSVLLILIAVVLSTAAEFWVKASDGAKAEEKKSPFGAFVASASIIFLATVVLVLVGASVVTPVASFLGFTQHHTAIVFAGLSVGFFYGLLLIAEKRLSGPAREMVGRRLAVRCVNAVSAFLIAVAFASIV